MSLVEELDWPAQSPDLNPIEHSMKIVGQVFSDLTNTLLAELQKFKQKYLKLHINVYATLFWCNGQLSQYFCLSINTYIVHTN